MSGAGEWAALIVGGGMAAFTAVSSAVILVINIVALSIMGVNNAFGSNNPVYYWLQINSILSIVVIGTMYILIAIGYLCSRDTVVGCANSIAIKTLFILCYYIVKLGFAIWG